MTERKNVTLPEPYASMYEDLKARAEFSRAHGSFSEFVQDKIEEFHDNPQKLRAQHHEEREEHHRKLKEALAGNIDGYEPDSGNEDLDEEQFFLDFIQKLKKQKKTTMEWHKAKSEVYDRLESGWMKKYSDQFESVTTQQFRARFLDQIGKEKIVDELDLDSSDLENFGLEG